MEDKNKTPMDVRNGNDQADMTAIAYGCLILVVLVMEGMYVAGAVRDGQWLALVAVNAALICFAAIFWGGMALLHRAKDPLWKIAIAVLTGNILALFLVGVATVVDHGSIPRAQHWLDGYRTSIVEVTDGTGTHVVTYYGDIAVKNRRDGTTVRVVMGNYDPESGKRPEYIEHEHPGCTATAVWP